RKRTNRESPLPGFGDLLAQLWRLDPLNLGPHLKDGIAHRCSCCPAGQTSGGRRTDMGTTCRLYTAMTCVTIAHSVRGRHRAVDRFLVGPKGSSELQMQRAALSKVRSASE